MNILIESTKNFEKDLQTLSSTEKAAVISKINECASNFSIQEAEICRDLHRPSRSLDLNGYESSLYILRVSQTLRVILAVDEDPIFGQTVFTLFRVVDFRKLNQTYEAVAESLYQELLHVERETTQIS